MIMPMEKTTADKKDEKDGITLADTGIAGLDDILRGGLSPGGLYLIEGTSGTGKTTLGLQFALAGAAHGEAVVYVTLSETQKDLESVAHSHGWDLDNVHVMQALAPQAKAATMFYPSEVELEALMTRLKEEIQRVGPARIVIDSLSEIRLMAEGPLRYRREMMGLKQFLASGRSTILLLEESTAESSLRTFADGVILLEQLAPEYGSQRRRLWIVKARGRTYAGGFHDFAIRKEGLEVFPRLVAAEHCGQHKAEVLPSGIASLDALLGGGLMTGGSTLLVGPAGTGKSSIAMQFAISAVERGGNAAVFIFDERPETAIARASGLHMNVQEPLDDGRLRIQRVDPAELTAGQFAHIVRTEAESCKVSVLVIDSLNGYLQAMPDQRFLLAQMHEILTYLGQQGVATFLVMGQSGVVGDTLSPANASYLTDNMLLFRFFEAQGEVRKAISVVKKRGGPHEIAIRELKFGPEGITVGEALRQFQGILTGALIFTGAPSQLMQAKDGTGQRRQEG
jgi:circadian clock protein KaiC